MFGLEKLFKNGKPEENIGTKSYFDNEVGNFAIWNNKYTDKNVISRVSYAELINLYTGWIYACINVRSNSLASLQPSLHPSKLKTDSILEDSTMDAIDWELRKGIASVLDLFGSCYLLKNKLGSKVAGFQILRSDSVRPVQTQEGIITGYVFHSGKRTYNFDVDEIVAIHLFNP